MKENSKLTMMTIIGSLGVVGITSTVAVSANNNYQRLFRNGENSWIITKEDLKQEDNTFTKSTPN
jgi:hypothetical protein